jgi:hypothetical protein
MSGAHLCAPSYCVRYRPTARPAEAADPPADSAVAAASDRVTERVLLRARGCGARRFRDQRLERRRDAARKDDYRALSLGRKAA